MTDTDRMVAWLRETLDAAERDAKTLLDDLWWADQAARVEVYNAEGVLIAGADDTIRKLLDDPAAVLRRIAADRKTLDDCDDVLHDFVFGAFRQLAYDTVRNLAEGWGWTEEEQR